MFRISPLLLVLAFPASLSAQSGIGVKAGGQLATNRSAMLRYDPVIGGVVGLYFPLDCGTRFEIQPELLVSAQGAALIYGENGRREMRSLYAQLPIAAKIYVSNALNLQGGVQGAMLLAASEDGKDVKGRYRSTDASLLLGLGVDMTSGWDLTFRYTSGLTPILLSDKTIYPTNRTLQASVGYRFLHFSHDRMRFRHR